MNIIYKKLINTSPATIYKAISTQEGVESWWAKNCNIATKVGDISKIVFNKNGQIFYMHFKIEDLKNDSKVIWTCVHNTNSEWLNTNISFDISGDENSSELVFKHYNFNDEYNNSMEADTWYQFMNSLKDYCETGKGKPWD